MGMTLLILVSRCEFCYFGMHVLLHCRKVQADGTPVLVLTLGVTVPIINLKDGEVLDGWWDSYPLGRHARVTIPVD